jgi:hypothetical protein
MRKAPIITNTIRNEVRFEMLSEVKTANGYVPATTLWDGRLIYLLCCIDATRGFIQLRSKSKNAAWADERPRRGRR